MHRAILRAIKSSFRTPVLVGRPPVAGKVQIAQRVARRERPLAPLHVVAHVDEDQVAAVEVTPASESHCDQHIFDLLVGRWQKVWQFSGRCRAYFSLIGL